MPTPIKMPDLGTTVDKVTLINWLKEEGQSIKRGEPLCEIETDKATTELESVAEGIVLKHLVPPGTEIEVGTIIAYIGQPGDSIEAIADNHKEEAGKDERTAPDTLAKDKGLKVSMMIRNLAKREGVNLDLVSGTGSGGQITHEDILKVKNVDGISTSSPSMQMPEIAISKNQLAVARTISQSWREIVPINLFGTILMSPAIKLRLSEEKKNGRKVSFDAIFIYAVAQVMKDFPRFQAYFDRDTLIAAHAINVGVAISVAEDLFIPVIKGADKKTIVEIDGEVRQYVDKAGKGTLSLAEITGATFTISNLGMFAIDAFTAIIPPQQVGILTIGSVTSFEFESQQNNCAFCSQKVATVILAVDHRFINGHLAAQFMVAVKQAMENL